MTCRGYDPKAVKIGKLIKISAAGILDNHQRGALIRSFVQIAREQQHSAGKFRNKEK